MVRAHLVLALIAALVAIAGGAAAFLVSPPTYKARADLLFVSPSRVPGVDQPINPFMGFGSALVATADVIRVTVSAPAYIKQMVTDGASPDFTVAVDTTTTAPVLTVEAAATSPGVVTRTIDVVLTALQKTLADRQREIGAPLGTWVTSQVIFRETAPRRLFSDQVRLGIIAFGMILALGLLVIFAVERRQRRGSSTVPRAPTSRAMLRDHPTAPAGSVREPVGTWPEAALTDQSWWPVLDSDSQVPQQPATRRSSR